MLKTEMYLVFSSNKYKKYEQLEQFRIKFFLTKFSIIHNSMQEAQVFIFSFYRSF